jgi:hypothetical protein
MIKIFCQFFFKSNVMTKFLQKLGSCKSFEQKLAVQVRAKNRQFFSQFFGENILKS